MKKKMKIALVTNNWEPYTGGLVSSLRTQIAALQQRGHKVMLITLDFYSKKVKDPYFVKRIRCLFRFTYKKNIMAVPWDTDRQMETLLRMFSPDIIHVHHPFLLGKSAARVAKKMNIPIVFTHHSLYIAFAHYIPLPLLFIKPVIHYLVKRFCRTVNGIIAPSTAVKSMIALQVPNREIAVIPSAIRSIFLCEEIPAHFFFQRPHSSFQLLCVSRFAREKNIPFLLDVFASLAVDHYCFTIAGYGYEQEMLEWYAYRTLGLSKRNLIFIQKPLIEDLFYLYKASDLFVFGGSHETQGIVCAEAMAAGLPVVAVDGPGQRDLIVDSVNGFIVHTKHEMTNKIQEIAGDRVFHERLRQNAYRTGSEYTPERMGQALLSFYTCITEKYKNYSDKK